MYEVLEGASSLEVCLVLANTGSYDVNHTLATSVSVHLSTVQRNNTSYEMGKENVQLFRYISGRCRVTKYSQPFTIITQFC